MEILTLPALQDNLMYLLMDKNTNQAAAIDPFDAEKMIEAASKAGVSLTKILTTHHHWDHSGGNLAMTSKLKNLEVIGGDNRIDGITKVVKHGEMINVGELKVECLSTPCHTTGHICYFVTQNESGSTPAVFTGDTLFFGGCGRFFEGTPDQMYQALVKTLGSLPRDTKVFCGHEYTVNNLKYAQFVEPQNDFIASYLEWAKKARSDNLFTIPSTIELEKKINPFMRVDKASVQTHAKAIGDPIKAMGFLRNEKNNFSG